MGGTIIAGNKALDSVNKGELHVCSKRNYDIDYHNEIISLLLNKY